jgi:hypothetical protein
VLAHTVCAALRRRLLGYQAATPDTLQRRFLSTGGTIYTNGDRITVRLDPPHLFTGPALRRSPRRRHPVVGWPHAASGLRLIPEPGPNELRENRR